MVIFKYFWQEKILLNYRDITNNIKKIKEEDIQTKENISI